MILLVAHFTWPRSPLDLNENSKNPTNLNDSVLDPNKDIFIGILCQINEFYWSLASPFVTVMDISATDRNPEPGDDPLLFSTDSKGSFRCTQPQTVSYAHHQAFVKPVRHHWHMSTPQQPTHTGFEPGTFWSRVTDPMRVTTEWGQINELISPTKSFAGYNNKLLNIIHHKKYN